jgi:hypothetical protein
MKNKNINESFDLGITEYMATASKADLEYMTGAIIGLIAAGGGVTFALIREALRKKPGAEKTVKNLDKFVNESSASNLSDKIKDKILSELANIPSVTQIINKIPVELATKSAYTSSSDVDLRDVGLFKSVLSTCKLTVVVNTFEVGEAVISFSLKYSAKSGGTNGMDVQYVTVDSGSTWKQR